MSLEDVYFFLPYVIAFFVLWWILRRKLEEGKRTEAKWRMFAAERGLKETEKGALAFTGENRGMPFTLDVYTVKSGDTYKTFTRMRAALPDLPDGLRLYHETGMSRIGKALGAQDIQTGGADFDRMFMVKGENPAQAKLYLTPERRHIILHHYKDIGPFEIRDGMIRLERPGVVKDMPELERLFSRLGDLAAALARP